MATETTLRPGELKEVLLKEIRAPIWRRWTSMKSGPFSKCGTVWRDIRLSSAQAGEMLEFTATESGDVITGMALNLEEDNVGAVILGDYLKLKGRRSPLHRPPARSAGRTGHGRPGRRCTGTADGRTWPDQDQRVPGRGDGCAGIIVRQPVKEPLQTGIKAIDAMIPIGRGQRELIIGDRAPARPPSRSIRSSIRRALASSAFMSRSVRSAQRWRRWWRSSKSTARWNTPSWS
jgi:F-type H+-transporting ATPase subunit alpha